MKTIRYLLQGSDSFFIETMRSYQFLLEANRFSVSTVKRLMAEPSPRSPGRGRPKLGVTAREVTLLPSHWEWLSSQPGGASAALRRLVDQARRSGGDDKRQAQEAAHRVMFALAGDLPDFEEATRAFYAGDQDRFLALTDGWPMDVRDYVREITARAIA